MKAIDAPKKIYLQPSTIEELPHQNIVYTKPLADNSIEYIRTDAFIEKAISYIQQHWVWNTKMIEDFKNYMKGK